MAPIGKIHSYPSNYRVFRVRSPFAPILRHSCHAQG
jgi:hypothetical protein